MLNFIPPNRNQGSPRPRAEAQGEHVLQAGGGFDAADVETDANGEPSAFPESKVIADLVGLTGHLVDPGHPVSVQVRHPRFKGGDAVVWAEPRDHGVRERHVQAARPARGGRRSAPRRPSWSIRPPVGGWVSRSMPAIRSARLFAATTWRPTLRRTTGRPPDTTSSSCRVGKRPSARAMSFRPSPWTHASAWSIAAFAATAANTSARSFGRTSRKSMKNARTTVDRSKCVWLSVKAGRMVGPPASRTVVLGPRRASITSFRPMARIRSRRRRSPGPSSHDGRGSANRSALAMTRSATADMTGSRVSVVVDARMVDILLCLVYIHTDVSHARQLL